MSIKTLVNLKKTEMKTWRLFFLFLLVGGFAACELDETSYVKPVPGVKEATDIAATSFMAHWDSVLGAQEYYIDVAKDEKFTQEVYGYFPKKAEGTSVAIEGLEVNTVYYYRVRFKNGNFTSENSEVKTVKTVLSEAPIALDPIDITEVSLTAVWRSVDGAERYSIDFSENPAFDKRSTTTRTEVTLDTFYVFNDLNVFQTYYYRVRSVSGKNGENLSVFSKIKSGQTTNLAKPIITQATEVSLQSFKANWEEVSGATEYYLDVSTSPTFLDGEFVKDHKAKRVTGLSETVLNLDATKKYYCRVRAQNAKAKSEYSDIIIIETGALEVPEPLAATEQTHNTFVANWEETEHAESYLISVYTDPALAVPVGEYLDKEAVGKSLLIENLQASTKFYYTIKAKGLNAVSLPSVAMVVETAPLPMPLLKTSTEIEKFSFECEWEGVEGVTDYVVELSTSSEFKKLESEVEVEGLSTKFVDLAPNTTYYVRVKGKTGSVFSPYSNVEKTVTKPIDKPILESPTKLSLFSFTASWGSIDGVESYDYQLATDAAFRQLVNNETTDQTFVDLSGLNPSTKYYFRVRGNIGKFKSAFSDVLEVTTETLAGPVIAAPSLIGIFNFTANWEAVDGADEYIVQLSQTADFASVLNTAHASSNYYVFEDLNPDTKYYYRVRSVVNGFTSALSDVMECKLLPIPAPVALDALAKNAFGFKADWEDVAEAFSYEFDLATDPDFKNLVDGYNSRPVYESSIVLEKLDPWTTYYYRIRAKRQESYSANSETIEVEPVIPMCQLLSIEDLYEKWYYKIQFTYDADGKITEFFENRTNTDDDHSFKISYDANGRVQEVEVHKGLTGSKLEEKWIVARNADGSIESWEVLNESDKFKHVYVFDYEDGQMSKMTQYGKKDRSQKWNQRSFKRYKDGDAAGQVEQVMIWGKREFRFRYDSESLNPLQLIDPDLHFFVRTVRKTQQPFAQKHNVVFEYWKDADPDPTDDVEIPQRVGLSYDINNLKLPRLQFTTKTIEYKYNEGCPIEKSDPLPDEF